MSKISWWRLYFIIYRHEAVIPWDVDADIAVRHVDLPEILGLEAALRAEGFDLYRKPNDLLKVFSRDGRITPYGWRYPAVDIWPMVETDARWAPSDLATRLFWVAEWLEAESFTTLVRRRLGPVRISTVPDAIAERYLARTYGHDWRTEFVDYQHGLPDPARRPAPARTDGGSPVLRRASGLELHEVADGLVVYQSDPPRVHHLNHTAALLFALCTGEATIDDLVGRVERGYDLAEPPVAEVNACLEHLCRERVLVVD